MKNIKISKKLFILGSVAILVEAITTGVAAWTYVKGSSKSIDGTVNVLERSFGFSVEGHITYGSLSGATTMDSTPTTFTIIPTSPYRVPSDKKYIHVTNATIDSYDSTTGTLVLSNATGNVSINAYCPIKKGELISFSLGNASPSSGTQDVYRVIKDAEGSKASENEYESVVEVVAMYQTTSSQQWNYNTSSYSSSATTNYTYSGSLIDTYLNTTWYGTLSANAKKAIVSNNITQYKYDYNSSSYNATTHASYASYPGTVFGTMTRNVYALDVQDIELYFGGSTSSSGTFSNSQVQTMLNNSSNTEWLRSAYGFEESSSYYDFKVWAVAGGNTRYLRNYPAVYYNRNNSSWMSNSIAVRPAFKINLTEISSWERCIGTLS